MPHTKELTLAQAQRKKMGRAIKARGDSAYNIWQVRPPFERQDLILSSDPQLETFYLVEGEPTFYAIDYLSQWRDLEHAHRRAPNARDFARVTTAEGHKLTVRLAFGHKGAPRTTSWSFTAIDGVMEVTLSTLDGYAQRIENWRRVIPCIRRVQSYATTAIQRRASIFVHAHPNCQLETLRASLIDLPAGLFYGAVATLLRRRELQSDLDTRPWSLETRLWEAAL